MVHFRLIRLNEDDSSKRKTGGHTGARLSSEPEKSHFNGKQ